MPLLVPTRPDDPETVPNRAAWEALGEYHRPFLVAFSDSDPITKGADRVLRERIPGARGLDHPTVTGAGHFLQEDAGEELGAIIAPPVPAFYNKPKTVDDVVDHTVGRILDLFDLDSGKVRRWS